MNEKPLTKAVWRTKSKGFPLFLCVRLLVVLLCILYMCVCVCVFMCVCSCTPLGFPVTRLRDLGWAKQCKGRM